MSAPSQKDDVCQAMYKDPEWIEDQLRHDEEELMQNLWAQENGPNEPEKDDVKNW